MKKDSRVPGAKDSDEMFRTPQIMQIPESWNLPIPEAFFTH